LEQKTERDLRVFSCCPLPIPSGVRDVKFLQPFGIVKKTHKTRRAEKTGPMRMEDPKGRQVGGPNPLPSS